MNLTEARLAIAKVLAATERLRLLNLSDDVLGPSYTKEQLLAAAPPLEEIEDDIFLSYIAERMSDNSFVLIDVTINDVSIEDLKAKLDKL